MLLVQSFRATSGAMLAGAHRVLPVHESHLIRELDRLHELLRRRVARIVADSGAVERQGAAGLVVGEEEIANLLDVPPWTRRESQVEAEEPSQSEGRIADLARIFRLNRLELDVCLLALAPEIHPAYGRLFAFLHDDVSRTRPTFGLALDVLAGDWEERLELRSLLAPDAPLLRAGFISVPPTGERLRIDEPFTLDDALLAFLLGRDPIPKVEPIASSELTVDAEVMTALRRAAEAKGKLIVLEGPASVGKRSAATVVAASLGSTIAIFEGGTFEEPAFRAWLRRCSLSRVWPAVRDRRIGAEGLRSAASILLDALAIGSIDVGLLLIEQGPLPPSLGASARVIERRMAAPGPRARKRVLERLLQEKRLVPEDPDDVTHVAATFPLTYGQIGAAVDKLAAEGPRPLQPRELHRAARSLGDHHALDRLAQRVPPLYAWEDLVLPPDSKTQLRELVESVRARSVVLDDWEFGAKISAFSGVNALFYGASGTGKTMAASVIAGELGMELYRIDLSRVINKYIGETEKNLEALFEQARSAYAILFFDEADALFGKRSEVRDAHDRYANVEVAYLLQRIETHDGVAILATNMRSNMDVAFIRRLSFAIEFPNPDVAQRLEIWKRVWPESVRPSLELDLGYLARQFTWSGGNIRNIALRAAYLAAAQKSSIRMPHVVLAAKREFQQLGHVAVAQEFGEYGHLI